jgi:hypothetical protein
MRTFIREKKVLDNQEPKKVKKEPVKKVKKDDTTALVEEAIKTLDRRTDNEYMPYFKLNAADKKNNVFAHLFVAKHCRNAYAGLFIKLNPAKRTHLTDKERGWVSQFRHKGYACVVISTINQFHRCVEAYKQTIGVSGYNYFYATYERSHL